MRVIRPTKLTVAALAAIALVIAVTAAYLVLQYDRLPDILAVHFNRAQRANGWQFKTHVRVLTPVFIQGALALVSLTTALLLLLRPEAPVEESDDVRAAAIAAEAVVLFAAIWIVFQVYVGLALVTMWQQQRGGLGIAYLPLTVLAGILTIVTAARAQARLGAPAPRPFVAAHWRLQHLYSNAADPALFVPTRDGRTWTLNFGRPVTAALLAATLLAGVTLPPVILALMLR